MPKTEEIINGLQTIVNEYSTFAIIWHAVLYLLAGSINSKMAAIKQIIRVSDLHSTSFSGCICMVIWQSF